MHGINNSKIRLWFDFSKFNLDSVLWQRYCDFASFGLANSCQCYRGSNL